MHKLIDGNESINWENTPTLTERTVGSSILREKVSVSKGVMIL